jgi:hypothetical protein
VLILKGVKVVCFDTLLQVLILKGMEDGSGIGEKRSTLEPKGSAGGMPPRVFCKKSQQLIENKGRGPEKERKERKRVRKRKEAKEIEEVREMEGENSARFVRENTRNGTIDAVCLSIVNLSSMV